jgi:putative glutamine amidotransferase
MKKPWIGIPTRYHEKTETWGQIRHYLEAVIWAGGLPLMIPTVGDGDLVLEYVKRIDGVLLPGSPTDIDPLRYGAEPHPRLGRQYPERDSTDFILLEQSEKMNLPLLGICFGVQSLNVYRGGTLIQDIPSIVTGNELHDNDDNDDGKPARHKVRIAEESLIERLAGTKEIEVNSYHHQAVEKAGHNLRSVAFAPDGVIEAIEDTSGRFILGVQWHPERGWQNDGFSKALFRAFVEQAAGQNVRVV